MRALTGVGVLGWSLACAGAVPAPPPADAPKADDPAGTWTEPVEITMYAAADAEECAEYSGRWDDACVVKAANTVTIGPRGEEGWPIEISTVGSNVHICEFSGLMRNEASPYVVGSPGGCVVMVKVADGKLDAEGSSECQEHCGANAVLAVSGATR